jgi:hypothetical protein
VNSILRGHCNYHGHGGGGFGGRGSENGSSSGTKPICQLCKKTGHTMLHFWKRFDKNVTSEEKAVNNAEGPGYNADTT